MTIFNLGSINADLFYRVPHLPAPGETLAATAHGRGLGGKGANQSVAAAHAGAQVCHIGAVGEDGAWMRAELEALGVDCRHVLRHDGASGHAVIAVAEDGENSILLFAGANREITPAQVAAALATARAGDWLLLQNETSAQLEAARIAQEQGLFVVYSAAPFEAEAVIDLLPHLHALIMNEIEATQLCSALGCTLADLPMAHAIVTQGARGAVWHDLRAGNEYRVAAVPVTAIDTTAAGDSFTGYLVAGLAEGMQPDEAMRLAAAAAALKVTRAGTAEAIPTRDEVDAFLKGRTDEALRLSARPAGLGGDLGER
ncbi:MAG: ribokinase [Paenirhodobacter sp.]|uniref:ribokinase n=1 Tax=Paenirhodobacter sp. TaxID=1965326 RepID=UPI003D0EF7AF